MTIPLPDAEEYEVTRVLIPRIRAAADRLSEQALRMEDLADAFSEDDGTRSREGAYTEAVAARIRDLMNELANLSLGGIIASAGQADVFRATAPAATEETP